MVPGQRKVEDVEDLPGGCELVVARISNTVQSVNPDPGSFLKRNQDPGYFLTVLKNTIDLLQLLRVGQSFFSVRERIVLFRTKNERFVRKRTIRSFSNESFFFNERTNGKRTNRSFKKNECPTLQFKFF